MAKKELLIPYVEYPGGRIYLNYRAKYSQSQIIRLPDGKWSDFLPIKEHPAAYFGTTLKILDGHRGRSAAQIEVQCEVSGYIYTMFFGGFLQAVKSLGVKDGKMTGTFIHVKRGSNYGIEAVNG